MAIEIAIKKFQKELAQLQEKLNHCSSLKEAYACQQRIKSIKAKIKELQKEESDRFGVKEAGKKETLREYLESYDEPLDESIFGYWREKGALGPKAKDVRKDIAAMRRTFKKDNSKEYVKAHRAEFEENMKGYKKSAKEIYDMRLAALKEKHKKSISMTARTFIGICIGVAMLIGSAYNQYVKPIMQFDKMADKAVKMEQVQYDNLVKMQNSLDAQGSRELRSFVREYDKEQGAKFDEAFVDHFGFSPNNFESADLKDADEYVDWGKRQLEKYMNARRIAVEEKYRELSGRDK